MKPEVLLLR